MRRKIPNSENLYIDENGLITTEDDQKYITEYLSTQRGLTARLVLCNQLRYYEVNWLYMYACVEYPIFVDPDIIRFFLIPNGRREKMFMAKFSKPVVIGEEYRLVPTYPTVAVDKTGEHILRLTTNRLVNIRMNAFGYAVISVYDGVIQDWRDIVVHRLVANAWVLKDQDSLHYAINHRDGNKLNNHVSNLEWASHEENNIHASIHGLNPASRKCTLRNYQTGEILEFPSVTRMFAYLSIDSLWDCSIGYDPVQTLYAERYELRLVGDERPWFYDTTKTYINPGHIDAMVIEIVNKNETLVFIGLDSLIEYYKLEAREIDDAISELNDSKDVVSVSYFILDEKLDIEIYDMRIHQVTEVTSISEAREKTSCSHNHIRSMLLSNGRRVIDYWRMRLKTAQPWCPLNKCIYGPRRVIVSVIHKDTQQKIDYPSLREASKALNLARQTILRIARKPSKKYPFDILITERSSYE